MHHGEILRQILDEKGISIQEADNILGFSYMVELLFRKSKFDKGWMDRVCGRLEINRSVFEQKSTPKKQLSTLIEDFHSMRIQMEILTKRMEDIEKKYNEPDV